MNDENDDEDAINGDDDDDDDDNNDNDNDEDGGVFLIKNIVMQKIKFKTNIAIPIL